LSDSTARPLWRPPPQHAAFAAVWPNLLRLALTARGAPEIIVGIYPTDSDPAGLFRGLARIAGHPGRSAAGVRARSARRARD